MLSLLLFNFYEERDFAKIRGIKIPVLHGRSIFIFFSIQEKEDDTQDGIDQEQPLIEKPLLMMESTPSRENRDVILDVTLLSGNLAEVRN